MKIGIYREFLEEPGGLGGAEFCVAVLAEAFEEMHDLEIIHNIPAMTPAGIEASFGIKLQRTGFRFERGLPLARPGTGHRTRLPWSKCREARGWDAHVSAPYDVFICLTHFLPPFCHARAGLLLVLFPFFDRASCWPWKRGPHARRFPISPAVNLATQNWIWKHRFGSYAHRYAISDFARRWTKRWWDVDCGVLYPPVDTHMQPVPKQPVILSIARFSPLKQQRSLVQAFAELARAGPAGWTYECTGALDNLPANQVYFDETRQAAGSLPVAFRVNLQRADLEAALGSAQIFWHAMGYGRDELAEPLRMEHFGIVTVEAMAWGCVPVVINRGGQPEIVRHGIDGFVWDTPEALVHYTRLLMEDDALRSRMSAAARLRAQDFGKDRFVRAVAEHCSIPLAVDRAPGERPSIAGKR